MEGVFFSVCIHLLKCENIVCFFITGDREERQLQGPKIPQCKQLQQVQNKVLFTIYEVKVTLIYLILLFLRSSLCRCFILSRNLSSIMLRNKINT